MSGCKSMLRSLTRKHIRISIKVWIDFEVRWRLIKLNPKGQVKMQNVSVLPSSMYAMIGGPGFRKKRALSLNGCPFLGTKEYRNSRSPNSQFHTKRIIILSMSFPLIAISSAKLDFVGQMYCTMFLQRPKPVPQLSNTCTESKNYCTGQQSANFFFSFFWGNLAPKLHKLLCSFVVDVSNGTCFVLAGHGMAFHSMGQCCMSLCIHTRKPRVKLRV